MTIPYRPGDPDSQTVRITFPDVDNLLLERWTSYDFSSDFLTPADSFSFTLGLDEDGLSEELKDALRFGARIRLDLDGSVLATGHIDVMESTADRGNGLQITIHGRDRLGQTLDAVADPTYQLKEGGSLADLLKDLFAPFGWSGEDQFQIDPTANRNAKTGLRGTPTTSSGGGGGSGKRRRHRNRKASGPKPLKSFVLHQTKPYNHESVYHFASRVSQRHGLWIRCSADGETLIVGKPDFEQEASYSLFRTRNGNSNVLSGTVTLEMTNQPSILVADSFSGGGEYGKGRHRSYCVNPLLGYDEDHNLLPEVQKIIDGLKGATEVKVPSSTFFYRARKGIPPRPMYLHDDESKTQEQLENFVKREMSLLVRQGVRAHYVVEGHGQETDDGFLIWAPDTVVHVQDDAAGLDDDLYVLGCHYSKSRHGGTTTRLDLVLKNSLAF
jgi:prophage tail gpP-like protein